MGILNRIERRASPENPKISLDKPASWLTALFGDSDSAGVRVTPDTAISSSTVYACLRLLSETIASLPLVLYRKDGRKKIKAEDDPRYWLVHNQPNEMMNAFNWVESGQSRLCLLGNSYNEIELNNRGDIIGLLPLDNYNTTPFIDNKKKYFKLQLQSGQAILSNDRVLHVAGFGTSGILGLSPIETCSGAIGLALAGEKFHKNLFKNGVRPSGVLEHPNTLGPEGLKNVRESFSEVYGGVEKMGNPMVLEEGMKWVQMGLSPEDAQIMELRKFSVIECARIFNVPPHLIGDLERSTNNNIEQQSLEFVLYSIRSPLVRWERELDAKLIKPEERGKLFFKFQLDALLRGDLKTRFEAYKMGREMGIYSTNDVLELEDRNPVDGGDDDRLVPLNFGLSKNLGKQPEQTNAGNE